jgi:hypothetical protein
MARFKLALVGLAVAGAAILSAPAPAHADLTQARNWMAQRFQRGSQPVVRRQLVDRPAIRPTLSARRMAVHRPPPSTAYRRPSAHRMAARPRPVHAQPVVRQVVYQPYVVYYPPIVRRIYVVQW